ncbi:ATP-dependent DNA ligase [Sphingomonas turrisvirgatae]|uniref:DNA ligase (ATP) n=1 Tax=Sphingomonas turrisvirgatae TaxID=1888892 RepID=A0A1E3LR24_9SPHN|nr:ATP-dependent DNA ligase [Sphingomonas turrisvirgatae]ODP36227.1 ATP-dependent DNA ligase [Sphingomonas turrisvirgatae]
MDTAPLAPMEAKLAATLPEGPGWQYEPKWDGFRALAQRDGEAIELWSKAGKPLARYFPEMVAALRELPEQRFLLDGELVIPIGGRLSFDSLQARLHPAASRIERLSRETPAQLLLFDCLALGNHDLRDQPLERRRAALKRFAGSIASEYILLSPATSDRDAAIDWLAQSGGALDGVIAKPLGGPYAAGERAMVKVKQHRTADCVVGGYRETADGSVASLLLGLYDDAGKLDHVGFTSAFPAGDKAALLKIVSPHRGGPGFTGNAPGGPSRWNGGKANPYVPLKHELVVEVSYDQVTAGRFRHGTRLLRWRPDKAPAQCTCEQLAPPLSPAELLALI